MHRLIRALRRRDALCLATAYREPSSRALAELGIDAAAHVPVPDLTPEEVGDLVESAGGDAASWAQWVHAGGEFGHPQLVQAMIAGLRARGWPRGELQNLRRFNRTAEVESEQRATRQRLVTAVPEDAKALLYRMSLFFGRFKRSLVLAVAGLDPAIPRPGEQLDLLIGPWVDQAAQEELRISPLIARAGTDVLDPSEQQAVHRVVAQELMAPNELDITKANAAFLHALFGKAEFPLFKFGYSVLLANAKVRPMLSDWMSGLRFHRTDRAIYPDNQVLSGLLRLGQLLLLLETGDLQSIANCWSALIGELQQRPSGKARGRFEYILLGKILIHAVFARAVPEWIDLILRFEELSRIRPEGRKLVASMTKTGNGNATPTGMFFITQILGLRKVAELGAAFDRLATLTSGQREILFTDIVRMPSDFALIVNHAWLEEHKSGAIDWLVCAEHYARMAKQAQDWGYRELALRCHVARGVMFDEYGGADDRALQALDEAVRTLGPDPVLSRARAKVLYRRKDHAGALKLLEETADKTALNDPIERAFMLREAGISAAELDSWDDARKWFAAAGQNASLAKSTDMRPMAIGLRADEAIAAFRSNRIDAAIIGFENVLEELDTVDPATIKGAYCHRVIGHSILWLYGQATGQKVRIQDEDFRMVPGMCSNSEPPDLRNLPLASRDYLRYFLAETEIATESTAGADSRLREHLRGGAIPAMEIRLCNERVARDICRRDPARFVQDLPAWVDADLYLRDHHDTLETNEPTRPAYGEIDRATPERLQSPEAAFVVEDALLAFGVFAALHRDHGVVAALRDEWARAMPDAYPGSNIVEIMARGAVPSERLQEHVAAQVYSVTRSTNLTPDDAFIAGLRFVEHVKRSNFKRYLEPRLCEWTKQRWQYALTEQRFLFRNPLQTSVAIEQALAAANDNLKSVGKILLSAEPAVRPRLGQSFREFLASL